MSFEFLGELPFFFKFVKPFLFGAVALAGVGFLIAFHEFGHFILCKLFGVRTPTFSIGAGPRLFTWRWKETDFTLSALPIGGFVEMSEKPEDGQELTKGYFNFIPYYQKMLIITGGIFCNILFAWVAFTILFAVGMPTSPFVYPHYATNKIKIVAPESPAQRAGLNEGDVVHSIGTESGLVTAAGCIAAIEKLAGQSVTISVERQGQPVEVQLLIEKNSEGKGFLGVVFAIPAFSFSTSILHAFNFVKTLSIDMFKAFGGMFKNKTTKGISGPVMLISHVAHGVSLGWQQFLLLLAFISLNLGLLNLFPIPVMDGGQVLFYTIEAIIRRPLPDAVKFYIRLATWLLLLVFIIYISISEVFQIIRSFFHI